MFLSGETAQMPPPQLISVDVHATSSGTATRKAGPRVQRNPVPIPPESEDFDEITVEEEGIQAEESSSATKRS